MRKKHDKYYRERYFQYDHTDAHERIGKAVGCDRRQNRLRKIQRTENSLKGKSNGIHHKCNLEKAKNAHPYTDPKYHCLRRQDRNLLQLHERNKYPPA